MKPTNILPALRILFVATVNGKQTYALGRQDNEYRPARVEFSRYGKLWKVSVLIWDSGFNLAVDRTLIVSRMRYVTAIARNVYR